MLVRIIYIWAFENKTEFTNYLNLQELFAEWKQMKINYLSNNLQKWVLKIIHTSCHYFSYLSCTLYYTYIKIH